MKVYRDTEQIQQKERTGRRFSMAGLGILFVGLLASFVPNWYPPGEPVATAIGRFLRDNWVYISFLALPIGFVCASVGSFFINRFARRRWPGLKYLARPDEVLENSLKGLDDKYAYFAWTLPANYVLVGPCGILVFALRSDRGRVIVEGDRWREPFRFSRLFTIFAREGVGNPSRELTEQEEKLRQMLDQAGGEPEAADENADETEGGTAAQFADVPIESAVVFLHPEIELDLTNPNVTALRTDQLKGFVRRQANEVRLRTSTLRALTRYLEAHSMSEPVVEEEVEA